MNSGKVFTQADGSPWHPNNVSQAFERFIKRLALPPIRLHDLRHCAASLSLAAGLSMKAIQALLGHSSYQLTADTYTSLMPQFEQAAANAPVDLVPRRNAAEQPTPEGPLAVATVGDEGSVATADAGETLSEANESDQSGEEGRRLRLVLPSVAPAEATGAA
ncbi:tyrosine-type recombinase/integrase [Streptomyces sp. Je 1-332]|uniref:tyrosine-type recombinase/integrase n=1 Tax=Streptomyces sp. Je 1-332 TaxID=3231270 RepID=UPI00345A1FDB